MGRFAVSVEPSNGPCNVVSDSNLLLRESDWNRQAGVGIKTRFVSGMVLPMSLRWH